MTAPAPAAPWWKRYAKAVLGVLATLSPSVVIAVLALFGVHVDTDTAVLICGVLGALLGGATVAHVGNAPPPEKAGGNQALVDELVRDERGFRPGEERPH